MTPRSTNEVSGHEQATPGRTGLALALGTILWITTGTSLAAEMQVPWECSGYEGEAQARCLRTFIELQQDKIAKLEGEQLAQTREMTRLQEQVERQASANAEIQQHLANRPTTVVPVPSPLPYWYAAPGLSIYLGRPWIYGPPYYTYRPYV